jgi:hypothetical protein
MDVFAHWQIKFENSDYIKVKATWWNKGQMETPFPLGVTTNHKIMKSDLKNWTKYNK